MIIPKLRIKGKTTICYRPYPLPDPIRSIDDFWRLNCLDLDDMTEFELWQERERVKAALINVDPESPVWIPIGSDCISAAALTFTFTKSQKSGQRVASLLPGPC
jgi:hypothetical protein